MPVYNQCVAVTATSDNTDHSHSAQPNVTVDFDTQVIPLLTRYGCNSGACHGAAAGRGEFRLSLFGSRPEQDFRAIVHQFRGRRIARTHPTDSLIWQKATETISHGGEQRFADDSPASELLLQWLQAGATRTTQREMTAFDATFVPFDTESAATDPAQPGFALMPVDGLRRGHIRCIAVFRSVTAADPAVDGHRSDLAGNPFDDQIQDDLIREDVTAWTVLTAEDPTALQIDDSGDVAITRPGRHIAVARFLNRMVPVEILIPFPSNHFETDRVISAAAVNPAKQTIDTLVDQRLHLLGLSAQPSISDEAFLRRVMLDLAGRLPTPGEQQRFADSVSPDHRTQLIDELLANPAFSTVWGNHLSDLFRVDTIRQQAAQQAMQSWLRKCVLNRVGFDEMVRQMLTAEGPVATSGPTGFYLAATNAGTQAEYVSEVLLGIRLRCANCHDHPLDRWTQDDYHGLAAVFAGIERGEQIRWTSHGVVIHPGTGQPAVPQLPGGISIDSVEDGRTALAAWMTDPQHPLLARAFVNRVWQILIGRALVEPVDDFRVSNLPSNPELLDYLTSEFVRCGYDLRSIIRKICSSDVYRRRCSFNKETHSSESICG
ncbi:MAG: DUF1549 domain-containing protein, partial [Planctomycetaceae bacterium]|nr:DUF1549 domain-containing protein [Planctomycetaceae bacterium]